MFQPVSQLDSDIVKYWSLVLNGIEAMDLDRGLAIKGTRGQTKYAPKWTVWKMSEVQPNAMDYDAGRVQFRAWSIEEAAQMANEDKRLVNRITKAFGDARYDCTNEVLKHISKVQYWMRDFAHQITRRSEIHDKSKLADPQEKAMYDQWIPELQLHPYDSDEYKQALDGMGVGLQRHYKANRHHPEHFPGGINDMTLMDLVEMLADCMAAAEAKHTHVELDRMAERFGISDQLVRILANTLREDDFWNLVEGVPTSQFCPPEHEEGYLEARNHQ